MVIVRPVNVKNVYLSFARASGTRIMEIIPTTVIGDRGDRNVAPDSSVKSKNTHIAMSIEMTSPIWNQSDIHVCLELIVTLVP